MSIYLHKTYLHFSFLQNSRDSGTVLSTRQLVEFGLQISRGVSHLHSMGILHRDVSTRSCVYVYFFYLLFIIGDNKVNIKQKYNISTPHIIKKNKKHLIHIFLIRFTFSNYMTYKSNFSFINVFIYRLDSDSNVRVCDSALSRDLFPDDYHCLGDNENRPIKWMALETLQKKLYSTSSDIWSLGVLLWELATLAAMPFEVYTKIFSNRFSPYINKCIVILQEVDPFELGPYLRDGYRLGQPVNCPDEL